MPNIIAVANYKARIPAAKVRDAEAEEREACAGIADWHARDRRLLLDAHPNPKRVGGDRDSVERYAAAVGERQYCLGAETMALRIAAQIRERGETTNPASPEVSKGESA